MKISDRIKGLRINNSMTQKELANTLKVSIVSVQCWENGTKSPSMSSIISIANKFCVSTDYLLGVARSQRADFALLSTSEKKLLSDYRSLDNYGQKAVDAICSIEKARIVSTQPSESKTTYCLHGRPHPRRYIPRYSTPSAAGNSVPLGGEDFEMILADESIPYDADFAVGIQGDSMLPYIHDGDTVYVKRDCDLNIGDIGIFCVDGAMYCKQYYIDKGRNFTLVSTNPALRHTNVSISAESSSNVKCYGKVLLPKKIPLPDYFLDK